MLNMRRAAEREKYGKFRCWIRSQTLITYHKNRFWEIFFDSASHSFSETKTYALWWFSTFRWCVCKSLWQPRARSALCVSVLHVLWHVFPSKGSRILLPRATHRTAVRCVCLKNSISAETAKLRHRKHFWHEGGKPKWDDEGKGLERKFFGMMQLASGARNHCLGLEAHETGFVVIKPFFRLIVYIKPSLSGRFITLTRVKCLRLLCLSPITRYSNVKSLWKFHKITRKLRDFFCSFVSAKPLHVEHVNSDSFVPIELN